MKQVPAYLQPYPWGRVAFSVFLVGAGLLHLIVPAYYDGIMPESLPAPRAMVYLSGGAEILGGLGLLPRRTRRIAGTGIILLLVAILPANIQMLMVWRDRGVSWWIEALLWIRLPFQLVLIWWAWLLGRNPPSPAFPPDSEAGARGIGAQPISM